jgi:hypothetical protein
MALAPPQPLEEEMPPPAHFGCNGRFPACLTASGDINKIAGKFKLTGWKFGSNQAAFICKILCHAAVAIYPDN